MACFLTEFTMGRRMIHSTKVTVPQSTDTNPCACSSGFVMVVV